MVERTRPESGWTLTMFGWGLWLRDGRDPCPATRNMFTGDAFILGERVADGLCPVGILLDRLEEYPEECDAPPDVVAEAVRQLRERNPNGTETNW